MKKLVAIGMLAVFLGTVSLALASKEDEAKKATMILKTSKDTSAKVQACIDIGNLGLIKKSYAADALPYLVAACKEKDAKLRAAAAEALGKVDPPEEIKAVDLLTDMAKNDKDNGARVAAMRGLGAMGQAAKSALPTLREITSKEDKKTNLYREAMNASRAINAK